MKNEFDYAYEKFEREIENVDNTHYLRFASVCGWSLQVLRGYIYKSKDKYRLVVHRSSDKIMDKILSKPELMNVNYLDTLRVINIEEL